MTRTPFRVLTLCLLLLAAFVLPASPAHSATEPVSFSIDRLLYPGWSVGVNFSGGDANASFQIRGLSKVTNNPAGSPAPTITVPRTTKPGQTYKLTITQLGRTVATYYAYVGNFYPQLTPKSYYVPVGYEQEFIGSNFMPGEKVDLYLNGTKTGVVASALTAFQPNYAFNRQGQVPPGSIKYVIPRNLAGTTAVFQLRGRESGVAASTSVTVAQ